MSPPSSSPWAVDAQLGPHNHLYSHLSTVHSPSADQTSCPDAPRHDSFSQYNTDTPSLLHPISGRPKKLGRPHIDRSNTKCEYCGTKSTPQWRYLKVTKIARPDNNKPAVEQPSGGNVVKHCLCNACWLRVQKEKHKTLIPSQPRATPDTQHRHTDGSNPSLYPTYIDSNKENFTWLCPLR
eukprot:Protomagalhaensia_wolfi_Nauph_80__1403@NODE_1840_length_1312_cov_979_366064_g1250_i1_p1_GENE_NODE_1840_length_1312_cov_979_366064_g1250_i1NODE_1840_length_1312_cov_979_366064_g1250_i1_p1_ORF_typecomplete_len181_score0_72GATA/PF00320_27/2e06zfribbon_3/PF13248_6/2_7e02zfribbon_3/PF13248_6/0_51_NODE_1840_length_1312_cov_979_366064_g1250_i16301172